MDYINNVIEMPKENMTTFLIVIGILGLLILLGYIFYSIGLMKMCKKLNEKGGWMAWFPILNSYLLGKAAWTKTLGWTMLFLTIATSGLSLIVNNVIVLSLTLPDNLLTILSIILIVFSLVSLFKLYKLFSKKYIVLIIFTILSCGLLAPIFIFAIRKNELNIN